MNKYRISCVSDTGFAKQWHLDNTNQYSNNFSLDINACPAWDSTKGDTNIIVAIFDNGISKNHPDLNPLHSFSYNCETGLPTPANSLGFPFSFDSTYSHGTSVAGIIGARHNNRGYAGVAPNCRLMDIAYNFGKPGSLTELRLANGFDTAWRRGAAIINCSWMAFSGVDNGIPSKLMEAAMSRAMNGGRGAKGSIIVFAAGNFAIGGMPDYNVLQYPARALPEILAVGALDTNGKIADDFWSLVSHFGKDLDILAPGTQIPILDYNQKTNTNNYGISNGTSLAAPMVAGVAGLILSKNPALSRKQVVDIIEQSATKLPAYTSNYANTSGRPNGTWYEKSGYGLLNAHQAITSIPLDICTTLDIFNQNLYGTYKKCNTINIKDTKIYSGVNTFEHTQSTIIGPDLKVSLNSNFIIRIKN